MAILPSLLHCDFFVGYGSLEDLDAAELRMNCNKNKRTKNTFILFLVMLHCVK